MGNLSKSIASIVSSILAFVVAQFGLEAIVSPELITEVSLMVAGAMNLLFVYFFPANQPS